MDITVPFLIVIIIISCVLLYKIAGINIFKWEIHHKAPKPKEEKKEEPAVVVTTQKSFIKRKQKESVAESTKPAEPTNKPSFGAVVTPVFASENLDQGLNEAINRADKLNNDSNEYLSKLETQPNPVSKPAEKPNITLEPSLNRPAFPSAPRQSGPNQFIRNNSLSQNITSRDVENALFGNRPSKTTKLPPMSSPIFDRKPPVASIFDKRPPVGNNNPFAGATMGPPRFDQDFDDFDDSDFDDFFTPAIPNKKPMDDAEYFEKKVVGEKVANAKSKKKDKYWI